MKIIFMGNSIIACPILNSLNNSKHDLIGVVSNSPKPAGRGRSLMYSPVGQLTNELGLNFIPAKSLNDKVLIDTLRKLEADIFVVVAFRILPKIIFSLSKKGAINLHGSLLPKYRGAAPIQHSLLNGDKLTGVSTFFIDSNLDTGPIILQKDIPIDDQDTFDSLSKKMSKEGIGIIFESLDLVDTVDFKPAPQIEAEISHAPKISNKMYEIDWSTSATQINNKIRALSYAGAFTFINGKRIKIFKSKVDLGINSKPPGEISIVNKTRIIASCGSENLELLEIQIESKRRMRVEQWVNGNPVNDGDLLG